MTVYSSLLASYISDLIAQKHLLGYSFAYGELALKRFDEFCSENYPQESTITRAMGLAWAVRRPTEKPVSTAKRLAPVRELAKYMLRKGVDAYVIPDEFVKQPAVRYAPHIFTDKELECFFHETDSIHPHIHKECMEPLVMPVIFRLIYTCGLRPQEGRLIKRKDINLEEGVLFIPESKRHKDRLVVIPEDMLELCRRYDTIIRKKVPQNEYFFPSGDFTCYHAVTLEANFKRYWNNAGLWPETKGNNPRIYDFRHTFATKRLYQWMKDGRDVDLNLYLNRFHPEGQRNREDYLFFTIIHQQRCTMSPDTVAAFLKKYADQARHSCADIPESVHPHQFRHTRAISWYRNGVPLILVSELLGHADINTSQIYAYADTEMKRKAISKALGDNSSNFQKDDVSRWKGDDELIKKLFALS